MYSNSRHLITALFLFFTFVLWHNNLQAQSEESQVTTLSNSLKDGSWAFQFQVNNNFTLGSFQGAIISVKRHYADNKAIRLGIGLNFGVSNNDASSDIFRSDTITGSQMLMESLKNQSMQIIAQYLFYPSPTASINIFMGAGPLVQFFSRHAESDRVSTYAGLPDVFTANMIENTKEWSIGANAIAGAEWFVTNNISFHAEYGASIQHKWTKRTTSVENRSTSPGYVSSKQNEESTGKGWNFTGTSVKFGLSVYF